MLDPLREFDKEILPTEPASDDSDALDDGLLRGTSASESVGEELASRGLGSRASTPRGPTREVANVAVVFVHGMGTSKPGDMLESYMNPSLEWIKRATTDDHTWYQNNDLDTNLIEGVNILDRDRKPGASPATMRLQTSPTTTDTDEESPTIAHEVDIGTLRNALLHSTETTPAIFQPPYVDVDLISRQGDSTETRKMVAVEAWWDGEFEAPPFRQVAQWALGVAPSLILRHLALVWEMDPGKDAHTLTVSEVRPQVDRSAFARVAGVLGALLFTVVGGLMAILFQWVICLLLMLGSIPFLQKYVGAIILKMTTSFGDVLTYVHDGVRSAAIRSTVLRSFLWLSKNYKVEKLIVVAHSLGTVISYDVLNSRDFLRTMTEEHVTFVTFGSPLKKANLLLQLKRDEQRVSLGMLFASLSFLCALAALYIWVDREPVVDADPLNRWQWFTILATVIGSVSLGIGAHARPKPRRVPGTPFVFILSWSQYLGITLGAISCLVLFFSIDSGWRFVALGFLAFLLIWSVPVSMNRALYTFNPGRISQSMGFGIALLLAIALAGFTDALPVVACLLLAALLFSVMTGSNPLEEFRLEDNRFVRQMPKFSFGTPLKRWVDFWATNDLVSEFGLGDVRYRSNPDEDFTESPISRRITNMKSFIVDHTTYRQNLEQFIAPLTRLFLEEIGFRTPDPVAGQDHGAIRSFLGHTPIQGNYEQDITNAMQSRASRIRWLSWAGGLLMVSVLLFSPGVYRSIGEFIVFDEMNPVSLTGTGEPIDAPGWFTAFYNEQPKVCGEILCRIRHLPIVPNDVSEALIRNTISGNLILYGFGYGIAFAFATLFTRVFITIPWRAWESAILDTLLHKQTTFSFNRFLRGAAFFAAFLIVVVFAVAVNNPWLGMTWVWENHLAPLQTIQTLWQWFVAPLSVSG